MENIIKVFKNTSVAWTVTITNNGSVVNITDQTILFTVKKKVGGKQDDSDALISKTITSHSNPTQGETTLALTASDTNIEPGTYVADFRRIDSGLNEAYSQFTFVVEQTVTQRNS